MEQRKPAVGFIGLGLMGRPMARNLARAGFSLTVHNRTRAKAESLAAEVRCAIADTPRAVAEASEVVITMVPDVPDVEQVYLGPDGIIHAAWPGLICAEMETVGPECARQIAAAIGKKGAAFVDAPVSGGSWGAEQGSLSIMVGGSESAFSEMLPVFQAMGKQVVRCGPVGAGQATKLANQIVGALNLEAVCEGLLYASRTDADLRNVIDAVGAGASASWQWSNLGPRIARGDYDPGFKIDHMVKDLKLALLAAGRVGVDLPGVRCVLDNLVRVQQSGGGARGTQAMITALVKGPPIPHEQE